MLIPVINRFMFVCFLLSLVACTPVKPWQKGNLAKPAMSINPDPLETKLTEHIYSSKEGASGGAGVSGGGCGCN